jgi:hypothetical protein
VKELSTPSGRAKRAAGRIAAVGACLAIYAGLTAGIYQRLAAPAVAEGAVRVLTTGAPPRRNVSVHEGQFWVAGQPFHVKAVGWDPARPGELPWQRKFVAAEVEEDFRRIRAAGFNTLRSWAPLSGEELALAERHGLRVLQGIWVPPDARFADPAERRRIQAEVAGAVEASRWSPVVLGYLVLNEPRAKAVASAGLEATRSFLREVVATVRALDPSAPVGYASWPGLEALDDELLDFVAFNLYPHKPRVVMDELGLGAYTRMVARTIARGRPLLISEFGISVSPQRAPGTLRRGGSSEDEQALELLELARIFEGAGVAGTAVFQWNDGWWKNHEQPGDELTQDEGDPEEWFGLIRFASAADRLGSPRSALAALARHHRAVLLAPQDGAVAPGPLPVRLYAPEELTVRMRIDGGEAHPVALQRRGQFLEGSFELPPGGTRHDVEFLFAGHEGAAVGSERRLLRTAAHDGFSFELSPRQVTVAPGARFEVRVASSAPSAAGRSLSIAAYTEDRYNEQRHSVRLDRRGQAKVVLTAPSDETLVTLVAFEDDPNLPPLERAAEWGVVEVRSGP